MKFIVKPINVAKGNISNLREKKTVDGCLVNWKFKTI